MSPPCSILVNNTWYILADIDSAVLSRRIYISSSRTIISNPPKLVWKLFKISKKCCSGVFLANLSRLHMFFMLLLLTFSITCWIHILKSLMFESSHWYMYLNLAVNTFYLYKEKLLNSFSKILKKYLQLLTGLQCICYVIKTRVGSKIAEITRF